MKNRILGLIILVLFAHNFCQGEEAQFFFLTNRKGDNGENLNVRDSFVYTTDDPAEISFMRKVLNDEIEGVYSLWRFEISLDPPIKTTTRPGNLYGIGVFLRLRGGTADSYFFIVSSYRIGMNINSIGAVLL